MLDSELSVDESDDFYIGGELKTFLPLMPREKYTFTYNVIPLQIGRLSLPKFNLAEVINEQTNERNFVIKGVTKKCLVVK